ncbi:MAG: DUF3857 domain-containing protein [Steroidobacterales bacterium]
MERLYKKKGGLMRVTLRTFMPGMLGVLAGLQGSPVLAADWLPVTADDLHLTSVAQAPGAAAVILYRQVDRDDARSFQDEYVRVKILSDEGRKYADVEIPFRHFSESVRGLEARTIRADGRVVPFTGTVYEKRLVTSRTGTTLAKVFQIPDVQAGSIIEYRYRHVYSARWVFNSRWILSGDLFTREAKFSLFPNRGLSLRWTWPNGLPPGTAEPRLEKDHVVLEEHDVPAFVTEEHMQPENELKERVDFIYSGARHFETDPAVFWRKFGIIAWKFEENFVDQRKAMQRAVAQIVQPGDSDEAKLRKIYARTQLVRNLSYEHRKTEQEIERQDEVGTYSVADVWDRGAGNEWQINYLLLALVRAAGLGADPVLVARRDQYLFNQRHMNSGELDATAVIVKLDGKDVYLDPGTPFTPFGLQPWNDTDAHSLRLNADGGAWVTTPLPDASKSRIERRAVLKLSAGTLEGKLTVRYTGLEASSRRLSQRNEDDTARRQFLEKQIEHMVPAGIDVKLTNSPDWGASDASLVTEYDLEVPGWATTAGRRALLPVGLFGNNERHTFEHAVRVHPLYFGYPHQYQDDISIELPAGWHIESAPQVRSADLKALQYKAGAQSDQGSLHLTRELNINFYEATADSYGAARKFFQTVRTGDEEQVVIAPDASSPH